jgi:exopolyphosphatase/guanosine-5'-triphosphate,3'-diphosphate pyrophosphatase
LRLQASGQQLHLQLPADWLEHHPLSEADLVQETPPMTELGLALGVSTA